MPRTSAARRSPRSFNRCSRISNKEPAAMEEGTKKNFVDWILPAICLVLALATVAIVYFLNQKGTALQRLTIVVGYVIVILVFFFGLMVLIAMATNKIDI